MNKRRGEQPPPTWTQDLIAFYQGEFDAGREPPTYKQAAEKLGVTVSAIKSFFARYSEIKEGLAIRSQGCQRDPSLQELERGRILPYARGETHHEHQAMKSLNPALVATVQSYLKGVRLQKFMASVAVLNESLAQGAWTKRGGVKAQPGFYQGSGVHYDPYKYEPYKPGLGHTREYTLSASLSMCLRYGQSPQSLENDALTEEAIALIPPEAMRGTTIDFIHAWIALCIEKDLAVSILNAARPLPKRRGLRRTSDQPAKH